MMRNGSDKPVIRNECEMTQGGMCFNGCVGKT